MSRHGKATRMWGDTAGQGGSGGAERLTRGRRERFRQGGILPHHDRNGALAGLQATERTGRYAPELRSFRWRFLPRKLAKRRNLHGAGDVRSPYRAAHTRGFSTSLDMTRGKRSGRLVFRNTQAVFEIPPRYWKRLSISGKSFSVSFVTFEKMSRLKAVPAHIFAADIIDGS